MKPSIFCDLLQQTRLEHSSCENPLHMLADGNAGWVDFRLDPLWMTAELPHSFRGRTPVPRFYLPGPAILCAHSSPQEDPNKILFITTKLSAESWLLRAASFSHPLLSLGASWRGTLGARGTECSWRWTNRTQEPEDKSVLLKLSLEPKEIDFTVK